MDKTSREYAEKLAIIKYPNCEQFSALEVFYGRLNFVETYLTAIEETNAKGLLEAAIELVYQLTGEQESEEELEKGLGITLAFKVQQMKSAIRKAKEVTNGK
jgi:hypothetical protein